MQPNVLKVLSESSELGTIVELVEDSDGRKYVTKRIQNINASIAKTIFQKETKALFLLKACPNIVKIFDSRIIESESGICEGVISMEYVPGKTLSKVFDSIPNVAIRYSIVKQLISAIRYAHMNSVIHRDINPSNIIIYGDFDLKLIDFGISKIRGMLQNGTAYQFATQNYSAPEVTIHSENATERSDIYSLGAVIYYLFTGNTPPKADDIVNAISGSGGMDITLKNVLCKMCAPIPADRYENIDDCESDLTTLYRRYCGNDEMYYFSIDDDIVDCLTKKNIVRKGSTKDFILKEFLPTQFFSGFVSVFQGSTDMFRFDGTGITMDCSLNNNIFVINSIKRLDAYRKEQRKKYSLELSGRSSFLSANMLGKLVLKNNCNEVLCNRINSYQDDVYSQRNIEREYETQYGVWQRFIEIMIDDATKNAKQVFYTRYEQTDGVISLSLADDCSPDDSFNQETVFVMSETSNRNGKPVYTEVGSYIGYSDDGRILYIKPSQKRTSLSKAGSISVDFRQEISQYRRQEAALELFKRSETSNSGNIKGIIVGVVQPSHFQAPDSIRYFDSALDLTQKRAVKKILEADDIALIQGPPGTGKTNVLVEVVRQLIKSNKANPTNKKTILIVSQSHAAVDKILDDLHDYVTGDTSTIRIGIEEKIEPRINMEFGLEHKQEIWAKASVVLCAEKIKSLLHQRDIDFDLFCNFAMAIENLRIANISKDEAATCEGVIKAFEDEAHISREDAYVQKLLLMDQWCRHIVECNELGEYYIKDADIVTGTCSGFMSDPFVRSMSFDYVIIDEAAKSTIPEIMVSLIKARKVVMVGDHMQLPPVFDREAIQSSSHGITVSQLQSTGFGKLFEIVPDTCKETLTTQYRMHPCIGNLISDMFYEGKVQNGVSAEDRAIRIPFIGKYAITWVSTSCMNESRYELNSASSYSNPSEVTALQRILSSIDQEISHIEDRYSIGVITPYRAQLDLLRNRLKQIEYKNINVDINTVDAFQGSQRDIIIYSTVRSSKKPVIGFLKEEARLNVSFSRAKRALIIIGDDEFLRRTDIKGNRFPQVLKYIDSNTDYCRIIATEEI